MNVEERNMKRQKDSSTSAANAANTITPPHNTAINQINNLNNVKAKHALFTISGAKLYLYMVSLPAFAVLASVFLSLVKDFQRSVWTSCRVANYLPSISSAIGGYTPQRYIWRICISLHIAPRIVVCILYYNYYTHVHKTSGRWVRPLASVAALLHFLENMSLITLSYVSSTENYDIHESSFYLFIGFSQLYMIITLILFGAVHNKDNWNEQSKKSYQVKLRLWLFNLACLLAAGYFFFRHNAYCEPGMYTIFALCEYLVVLSNIAFHGSAVYDFGRGDLTFSLPMHPEKQE